MSTDLEKWTIYLLSRHPDVLEKVRQEHNQVFGPDPDAVIEKLRADPHLINALPYTTAVIKEDMRMFAGASSIREADEG